MSTKTMLHDYGFNKTIGAKPIRGPMDQIENYGLGVGPPPLKVSMRSHV